MYHELTDEQLAEKVSAALDLGFDSALRAIRSEDPDLGRSWAVSLLRRENEHEAAQARLTKHREALRGVALGA
jgi:hypothetical protein